MEKEITKYVPKYLTCQIVKEEHYVPTKLLQSITILEWKWDKITMNFVIALPLT